MVDLVGVAGMILLSLLSVYQVEQVPDTRRVTLSPSPGSRVNSAKGLAQRTLRSFATLRMTQVGSGSAIVNVRIARLDDSSLL